MSKKPKMALKQTDPKPGSKKAPKPAPPAVAEAAPATAHSAGQPHPPTVSSDQLPGTNAPAPARGTKNMDLTLKYKPNARKSDRLVIFDYTDRKGSVQFLRTLFGETVPETITVSGAFTEPAAPKAKETKEERKARLAALPKPTLAEKIAKAEERAAKLRAKLAAAQSAGGGDAATA